MDVLKGLPSQEDGKRGPIEVGTEPAHPFAGTFPVVGVGASAGGLEAFKRLLVNLPTDTGFAVVLVQHLDPAHPSILSEILGRTTRLPVDQVADGVVVEPNHVYVIPPNSDLTIANRVLKLTPRGQIPGPHMPIDRFLRSLVEDCGSRSIGVILSGTGTDGAVGLQAVKEGGGLTFVQDPGSAEFPGMPNAAEQTTCVDFLLSPERIAEELGRIARHPLLVEDAAAEDEQSTSQIPDRFGDVYAVLREASGIDFSLYRQKTMRRRIQRRKVLRDLNSTEEYVRRLRMDPGERSALQRDLLISVTSFFRDPESFAALKEVAFRTITGRRSADETIRVWVQGCATGEEAYSIAILWQDYFREAGQTFPVQIFASDISEASIEKARAGRFLANIAQDLSPERLGRYFVQDETGYQISKAVRDMCVFSRHNLIDDPPFAKLDLISCRNVLIYLGSVQKEIVRRFHYALKPAGFLFLGSSETASFGDLFSVADGSHRIFARRETLMKPRHSFRRIASDERASKAPSVRRWNAPDVRKEVDRVLLSKYGPAGVVVDGHLEVIEIRGHAAPYLSLPSGTLSFSLLKLIPDTGFYLAIEKLVQAAQASGTESRGEAIEYERKGILEEVDVEVVPLEGERQGAYLILFTTSEGRVRSDAASGETRPDAVSKRDDRDRLIAKLRHELEAARQRILSLVEDHDTASEEMQTATEDTLSANEELQSLNEELETAKEELQSANEELVSLNNELQSKNTDLGEAREFETSIVETVREPLLVLDTELRIKTANSSFYRTFETTSAQSVNRVIYSVCGGSWDIPALRDVLGRVLPLNKAFHDFEVARDFPHVGHKVLVLSGTRLEHLDLILLAIEDITRRREAEQALVVRTEHLRQAQKMEAIGRLAGGIAHDFNNLLTTVIGYSDLLVDRMGKDAAGIEYVQEIKRAGQKAASLTEQLLAFSRRKILQPKVLNLAALVADFERMLRRLLDERIKVVIGSDPDLWLVEADPGELSRILMNLCLNARDAMPGGGSLVIETANATLGEAEAGAQHLPAGQYVMLAVRDTGIGLDPEVQAHIFEPFFTTKELGHGTGLGLATVLGIVEQSGGVISCQSELGTGTTFKILLPAAAGAAAEAEEPSRGLAMAPRGSSEVILLVEDEPAVRELERRVLEMSGYVVLEAHSGLEGLELCKSHVGPIDLLFSDIMMPEIGGRELAERAAVLRPAMKVLFSSGHTQDVILREGIAKGTPFLQKPFTLDQLTRKVRGVLDAPIEPLSNAQTAE